MDNLSKPWATFATVSDGVAEAGNLPFVHPRCANIGHLLRHIEGHTFAMTAMSILPEQFYQIPIISIVWIPIAGIPAQVAERCKHRIGWVRAAIRIPRGGIKRSPHCNSEHFPNTRLIMDMLCCAIINMDMLWICYINFLDMSQPRSYNMLQPWPRHRDTFFSSRGTAEIRKTPWSRKCCRCSTTMTCCCPTLVTPLASRPLECERCSFRSTYS